MRKQFLVPRGDAGKRLLQFLKSRIELPTKELRFLVEHHCCHLNGKSERFCSTRLKGGEKIEIRLGQKPPKRFDSQRILHEDSLFIVYNKPAHLSCEKLVEASSYFMVHRLDRDTTGLLLLAKTEEGALQLEELFRERKIKKTYLAVVCPPPTELEGLITTPIAPWKRREGALLMQCQPKGGLSARTKWRCLKKRKERALIECFPITGRTHQIRVHLASLNMPIVGDLDYGCREQTVRRPLLHAHQLEFNHPLTGEPFQITAPLCEEMLCFKSI